MATKKATKPAQSNEEFDIVEFPESVKQTLLSLLGQIRKLGGDISLITDTFMKAKEMNVADGWTFHPEQVCLFKKKETKEVKESK